MKKKLFCFICTMVMILTIPVIVSAKTYGGELQALTKDPNGNPYTIVWIVDESRETLYIEGKGSIPDVSGSCPWMVYKGNIKHLIIDDGINAIPKRGFADLSALETILLPDTMKDIGMYAFMNCASLKEIVIPGSTYYVQDQAFVGCKSLKKVIFETGYPDIPPQYGARLFGECTSLEDVYIYNPNAKISRSRSNDVDGVWFRDINDFSKLTIHCIKGTNADKYFTEDIYTITNQSEGIDGNTTNTSIVLKPNYMTENGYSLNVDYIE